MTKLGIAFGGAFVFAASTSSVLACGHDATEDGAGSPDGATLVDSANTGDAHGDASADAPAFDGSGVTVRCSVAPCAKHVSAGASFACAVLDDGTVWCWGDNANGQLGRGDASDAGEDAGDAGVADPGGPPSGVPMRVGSIDDAVQISAAGTILGPTSHEVACVRRASGKVACWGDNAGGQLGLSAVSDARSVTAGPTTACAITADGKVACYGPLAAPAGASPTATSVATAYYAALAVADDRALWSWGRASAPPREISPLGRVVSAPTAAPTPIPGLSAVSSVTASAQHACAITEGHVVCWGSNTFGQLGIGSRATSELPLVAPLPGDARVSSLALSERTSCAVAVDGRAFCWGANDIGELGHGDDIAHFGPVEVRPLAGAIVEMATMDFTTCALLESGQIVCWGYNGTGGLGIGAIDYEPHPDPSVVRFDSGDSRRNP